MGISQNTGISVVYTKVKSAVAYLASGDTNNTDVSHRLQFMLRIHDSLAYYEFIKPSEDYNNEGFKKALMFTSYQGPYFFSLNENLIYRKKGKYLLEKDFSEFNWYLENDMAIIKNFTCYKATTNIVISQTDRNGNSYQVKTPVVAWYTTDICVSAGPDGFAGLPGLIVKIEIRNEITELESIEFNQNIPEIKLPSYKEKMTETEFKAHTESILDKIKDVEGNN